MDWNNDGRKDLLCGNAAGYVWLLLNEGTDDAPAFYGPQLLMNGAVRLSSGSTASPVAVDWNRDGKKDLIVGGSEGQLRYFENKGTDDKPVFNGYTLLSAGGRTIDLGYYSRPEVADWDNDGWMDLVAGSYEWVSGASSVTGHVFYFHALSGPYLKSRLVRDGNLNNFLERGETVTVTTVLTNAVRLITGLTATLSTTSPWCTITNPSWSVGDFDVNRAYTNAAQPFALVIATNAPFGVALPLKLTLSGNEGTYRQVHEFSLEVAKPTFSIAELLVNDGSGNGNCACNPGEAVQLLIKLRNSGYRADRVIGTLSAVTPGVVMQNSRADFGSISSNTTNVVWQAPFAFTVPPSMPSNAIYLFNLTITYQDAATPTNLPVRLGDYAVTGSAPFAWQDMAAGTLLSLGDEGYQTVPLGMNFAFYGMATNYIGVLANGYVMFGSPYSSYSPMAIPNVALPNRFIAPWWEDLNPGAGGTVKYRLFGAPPNRWWVAEWSNVPRYSLAGSYRNFQVLLYEDGSIKFQYGTYSGTLLSRVIGIENADGTMGKSWTAAVTNRYTVLFTVQAGSPDTDADGLPDAYELFCFGNLARTGAQDSDLDGVSNQQEFRCGTNPNDRASRFCLQALQLLPPTQFRLQWLGVPGKPYSVWKSSADLGGWGKLNASPINGSATGTNYYTDTLPAGFGPHLYRLSTP